MTSVRSPAAQWPSDIVCVPSQGIFKSALAPEDKKLGICPSVPVVTEATALAQGQSSVKTTAVPSGVEV